MSSQLITVKGLKFVYEQDDREPVTALQNINMEINSGEHVAIIGPNGSGKSTLIKHFNGLLVPTAGEVIVDGLSTKVGENCWHIRQICGMVFQNPDNQIVATTVEEDVAFGLENLAVPSSEIRNRVQEALAMVGMKGYQRHAPHLLSGGQKQRVAIAGILAMRPRCLLLDEPTAMLDPRGKQEVNQIIKRLNQEEKITVVRVTHFMEEAAMADRIIVLNQGEVALQGPPQQVFSDSRRLRELGLENPPIAELACQLREAGLNVPTDILTVDELVNYLCS